MQALIFHPSKAQGRGDGIVEEAAYPAILSALRPPTVGPHPRLRTFRLRRSQRFGSDEVAMEHFRHQYCISTAEQEAIVRDHLGRVLKQEDWGFGLSASSIRVKILWENE